MSDQTGPRVQTESLIHRLPPLYYDRPTVE